MRGKKARKIRNICRKNGAYSEEPEYRAKKTDKIVYFNDKITGEPKAQKVTKITIFNMSKIRYRKMKKLLKGHRVVDAS